MIGTELLGISKCDASHQEHLNYFACIVFVFRTRPKGRILQTRN